MIGPCHFCKQEKEIAARGIACGPGGGFVGLCHECSFALFEEDEEDD